MLDGAEDDDAPTKDDSGGRLPTIGWIGVDGDRDVCL